MLYVYSANLKQDKAERFQEWAQKAERRFASAAPKGWSFKGIFVTAFGFGPAQVEVHWEVDQYSAFDAAIDAQKSGGEYVKALEELFSHVDQGSRTARLLSSVADKNLTFTKGHGIVAF
jgi:hypothetical protein